MTVDGNTLLGPTLISPTLNNWLIYLHMYSNSKFLSCKHIAQYLGTVAVSEFEVKKFTEYKYTIIWL